jgi:hypothetical protein
MIFSVYQNVDHRLSFYVATKKANELMAHIYPICSVGCGVWRKPWPTVDVLGPVDLLGHLGARGAAEASAMAERGGVKVATIALDVGQRRVAGLPSPGCDTPIRAALAASHVVPDAVRRADVS